MKFTYTPFLDEMIKLYQAPRTYEDRFNKYLDLIQGDKKGDMSGPLAFFNPMAKDHILEKLTELNNTEFEKLMEQACQKNSTGGQEIQMYFNLADDVAGGWTTRESTHSKSMEIKPFLKRNLGIVVFYASEDITPELINERVDFYCHHYNAFAK
jgi:hypothetical protein